MNVAIVGAGPAGSLLAYHLARDGASVTIFDASHPREKPCGGGLTAKALALLPPAPDDDPLPARPIVACRFDDGPESVRVALTRPVAIASRAELDAWLLRRAVQAGARHRAERIVQVDARGAVRTNADPEAEATYDVLVGADGAGSLVRRTLLAPTPPERLCMAAGWFAPGDSEMHVRFAPDVGGYLWLFPRRGHVSVGICAPLQQTPTRGLLARLEAEVLRSFPALADGERYAHTIPSPSAEPSSLLEIAGDKWALVGDAAALADPITGEGIYPALQSAVVLAETLRAQGTPREYPSRLLAGLGREMLAAAALRARFYAPGFTRRMVQYASRSAAVRDVLQDLVMGEQGYLGLKARLLRAAPRFALESVAFRLGRRSA
jgi:flavin-dependent dehydrogenase